MTTAQTQDSPDLSSQRRVLVIMLVIFLSALGVRLLVWQHNRASIEQVMTGLTAGYRDDARNLINGKLDLFLRGPNPPSDANVLAHPPGYSILMAGIFSVFGESDAALRFVQMTFDALAAVLIFLIVSELLPQGAAIIAGALVALSPQLAYNSLLLLPDSLAVMPVLLALYLIVRAVKEARLLHLIVAGALVGMSCWLRPNALLLALLMACLVALLFRGGMRWRYSLTLLAAALLMIAPLTIRNAIVFRRFIPLSLGSGITLIEGIADYDKGQAGLPKTDMEVLQWEAKSYSRPDYAGSLYSPDGVERERARVAHGIDAIRSRPFWFSGVMLRRAASMLRLERVPVINGSPLTLDSGTTSALVRYPGMLLKSVQKLFITAIMLPLFLVGIFLLARMRDKRALAMLLVVPVYYLSVQSLLHTEYRYVIAIQYFLLSFVAVTLYRAGGALRRYAQRERKD